MALPGQATGGFTESSSALRILHAGIRNSYSTATPDCFTQTNPPLVTTVGTVSTAPGMKTTVRGILSGSVAFSRPDVGSNYSGGPQTVASGITAIQAPFVKPLGLYINTANGNLFENLPAVASNVVPYVCGKGTYGSQLYETQAIHAATGVLITDTINWSPGFELIASLNGYLMPKTGLKTDLSTTTNFDVSGMSLEVTNGATASTTIGVLRMIPDSTISEIVFDLRV